MPPWWVAMVVSLVLNVIILMLTTGSPFHKASSSCGLPVAGVERPQALRSPEVQLKPSHHPRPRNVSVSFPQKRSGVLGRTFVCVNGRVLPVLQVLGAQQAGSTSLYSDLRSSLALRLDIDCTNPKNFGSCKEPDALISGRSGYDQMWGDCQSWNWPGVVADFTTDNLWRPSTPYLMQSRYGKEAASKLVFVIALREPVSQMVSAFYHGVGLWIYTQGPRPTFQEHADAFLHLWKSTDDLMEDLSGTNDYRTVTQGLYYRHLKQFLTIFAPSQFVIFPGNVYITHRVNPDTNPVLEAIRARLGEDVLRPGPSVEHQSASNQGRFGRMQDVMVDATFDLLKQVFAHENDRLVQLLADKSKVGMTLAGFTGQAGDVEAVGEWLRSGWLF